jgi:hypothetical protein
MKKKILWAFLLLVIIGGVLLFLVARYTDRIIDPYVRSVLEQQKPMNHRIQYKDIRVNLIGHVIKITNVRIFPDSSLVKDENLWFEINVSTIKLTDFSLFKMLFHKSLAIGDFMLLTPEVYVHLPVLPPEKIVDKVAEEKKPGTKAPLLTKISLERLLLSGGNFLLIRGEDTLASSPDISILVQQIKLEKNSQQDPIGYTYGDVSINLSNIKLNPKSGLYNMSLGSLSYHKIDTTAVLKDFRLIPKYDKNEFAKHQDFQAERMDVKIGRIDIERIGIKRLLAHQPLNISKILIDSVDGDFYRDKNRPVNLNKFPLFYNESFLKIGIPVKLDTVMVISSKVMYNELAEGKKEAGEITLNDFSVTTYGIANYVVDSTIKNEMKVFVNAKIMNEGPMNVELVLPLEGDLRTFTCKGSVGTMKLFPVNGMLEPSLNMIFKAGTLTRMTFDFTGTDNVSKGWMEFLYKDLDVVVLGNEAGKEKGFVSWMANTVTHSNNPYNGRDIKAVEIGFERNKNKGIIGYIWKTIQSGMVRTILPTGKYVIKKTQAQEESKKEKKAVEKKGKEKKTK